MRTLLLLAVGCLSGPATGQSYTSYFTGSTSDIVSMPEGGVCLMGGATESDDAMRWFLRRATGGDILVLRASGSNGYNDYFYSQLGVAVNSVETIVFHNATASQDPYVHQRIQQAEAIWFAGGDQWNYVSYWRDTPVDSLINAAIADRSIVIGGTSAGMAILGGIQFTAQNGTVTSSTALNDPYANAVALSDAPFLQVPFMQDVITDTHYDNPDRRGRHMVFLARAFTDMGVEARGIACEEYTAVCVAPDGIAQVFGGHPQYQDFAWFVRADCPLPNGPETCLPGQPLTWVRNGTAVKACKVPGNTVGSNTFDLNDWKTTSGGAWEDWTVQAGSFAASPGAWAPDCAIGLEEWAAPRSWMSRDGDTWVIHGHDRRSTVSVLDLLGRRAPAQVSVEGDIIRVSFMGSGPHLVRVAWQGREQVYRTLD